MNKRVLLISYVFPPVGGAGVQRVAKFAKYLPCHGWSVSVLTAANPSVPLQDRSLAADLPAGAAVRRARTWEPGYAWKAGGADPGCPDGRTAARARRLATDLARRLSGRLLQPDPQILWAPRAIREGARWLRAEPHGAIVASGPPFSTFLIGAVLSRAAGLPLVLDYRDEWDISNAYWENRRPGRLAGLLQRRMQRWVVREARAVVATTRSSLRALDVIRTEARANARLEAIYNGFDTEDFPPRSPTPRGEEGRYRMAYVGTLWNLTSVAPLVSAVRALDRRRPDLTARLELVFAGRRTPAQQRLLDGLSGLPCRLVAHPYLEHRDAVELLRAADGLLVLLSDAPEAGRVVPAKLFEYLAAGRPILAIVPPGEVWDLLGDDPASHRLVPGDIEGIASALEGEIERHGAGAVPDRPGWCVSGFDRRHQAGQLAEVLDDLVGDALPWPQPVLV